MKRLTTLILALAFGLSFLPQQADAAGLTAAQRRQILVLRVRLSRLPAGQAVPASLRRVVLSLTRLSPQRAPIWLRQAIPKISPELRDAFIFALGRAQETIVRRSPLISPAVKTRTVDKVEEIITEPTPAPTPTPYQA